MKILVTGGSGMLGTAVRDHFRNHELTLTDFDELDVRDLYGARHFIGHKFDVIIHLAALTDLEFCERNPSDCYMVNTIGTANMVRIAEMSKAIFVLVSTAGIFDGTKNGPYNEGDHPNPLNHYGLSKLYAEQVAYAYEAHYIIRTTGLFGMGAKGDNKIVGRMLAKLGNGEKTLMATDFKGSLTSSKDLAKSLNALLEQQPTFGVYHVAGLGAPSRLEIARFIIETLGVNASVTQVSPSYFKNEFTTPRPRHELLDSTMADIFGFSMMRDWKVSLEEYLRSVWN